MQAASPRGLPGLSDREKLGARRLRCQSLGCDDAGRGGSSCEIGPNGDQRWAGPHIPSKVREARHPDAQMLRVLRDVRRQILHDHDVPLTADECRAGDTQIPVVFEREARVEHRAVLELSSRDGREPGDLPWHVVGSHPATADEEHAEGHDGVERLGYGNPIRAALLEDALARSRRGECGRGEDDRRDYNAAGGSTEPQGAALEQEASLLVTGVTSFLDARTSANPLVDGWAGGIEGGLCVDARSPEDADGRRCAPVRRQAGAPSLAWNAQGQFGPGVSAPPAAIPEGHGIRPPPPHASGPPCFRLGRLTTLPLPEYVPAGVTAALHLRGGGRA